MKIRFAPEMHWFLNYLLLLEIFSVNAFLLSPSIVRAPINRLSASNSSLTNLTHSFRDQPNGDLIRPPLKRNLRKRNIFLNSQHNELDECCETVVEVYKPLGGVSRFGKLLILYRDESMVQTFYQLSCKKDILNKPCKFLDKRYESRSVCTQRYSYTLALVREPNASDDLPYRLDNIRIKNGCVCGIKP